MLLLTLAMIALNMIPSVQGQLGTYVSDILAEKIGTDVQIESVRIGLANRIILDDVRIRDKHDTLMVKLSRIAAKIEVLPLLSRQVKINNAQILGGDFALYQDEEGGDLNIQFLIDSLSNKNKQSTTNFDIQVGTLLVRRCNVRFDKHYIPMTEGRFSPAHIGLHNLSITAHAQCITPDSLDIHLRKMSFSENSGPDLEKLSFRMRAGKRNADIQAFTLQTKNSSISIPEARFKYDAYDKELGVKKWVKTINDGNAEIVVSLLPSEFATFLPRLETCNARINLESTFYINRGKIDFPTLLLYDGEKNMSLNASGSIRNVFNNPELDADIHSLATTEHMADFIHYNIYENLTLQKTLPRIGQTLTKGHLSYASKKADIDVTTNTSIGSLEAKGWIQDWNRFDVDMSIKNLEISKIANEGAAKQIERTSLHTKASGQIKGINKHPEVTAEGVVEEFIFRNHIFRNIPFTTAIHNRHYDLACHLEENDGAVDLTCKANDENTDKNIILNANVKSFSPYNLNMTKKLKGERFSGDLEAELNIRSLDEIAGKILLSDLTVEAENPETNDLKIGDIQMESLYDEDGKHISIASNFLNMDIEGDFRWNTLYNSFLSITHDNLPSVFPQPKKNAERLDNDLTFTCRIQDTTLLHRFTGTDIRIPRMGTLDGSIDDETKHFTLQADFPEIKYRGNEFTLTELHAESNMDIMSTSIRTERMSKGKPVEFKINAFANKGKLNAKLCWDNHRHPSQQGEINITGNFAKDPSGKQSVFASINKSEIIISDTLWNVAPATATFQNGILDISNLKVSNNERHLAINGRVSREETDTLTAELKDISLSYVFDIINFHAVEFDGKTTGRVYARSLTGTPTADAFLHVNDFAFNGGYLGEMDIYGNYGKEGNRIGLDAHIRDLAAGHTTNVVGSIVPEKAPNGSLDLNIKTKNINLYFLNKYTSAIFHDLQGRASGWARVYGPFKKIDIEGDVLVENARMHVNVLGTDYQAFNDSVILRPGNIWVKDATIYDYLGKSGDKEHSAKLTGHLMHDHFGNLRYDFSAKARNILGYYTTQKSEQNFYGTVFATGDISLKGEPGSVSVDMKCTPNSGTFITYNVDSPETITEAEFITYVSSKTDEQSNSDSQRDNAAKPMMDIRLNFNLDINPEATMRLVMDQRTEDDIHLFGNGHIIASYHNKGKFQMYGTYHVDHGLYNMSIQDVLKREFKFLPGGTIIFGGNPYEASINMKAAYSVMNVSLDDLSSSGLGLSNMRVDCLMNITGKPKSPFITFDFDIPSASEEEKHMVHSLISTEEEKNMQVIYLLGLGRFYSYGTQHVEHSDNFGGKAMNSILTSTISNQINEFLTGAVKNANWSFGTNFKTGETGWDQIDVEGILTGHLFNNRLKINGNFGYRDKYYSTSTSNFVGDFDIQYLLNKAKTLSLKVYNQTNDRYFVQSSLTTQGIGLSFQHDFNSWKHSLMSKKRKKKNKENAEHRKQTP